MSILDEVAQTGVLASGGYKEDVSANKLFGYKLKGITFTRTPIVNMNSSWDGYSIPRLYNQCMSVCSYLIQAEWNKIKADKSEKW